MEPVVHLGDLELLELDGGRIEGEPRRERELGVHWRVEVENLDDRGYP